MATKLYWIDEAWPGKVALASRPRGGDWLQEEIADWKREGVGVVLSLLVPAEEEDMELRGEAAAAKTHGLTFSSFPIPDRQVPASEAKLAEALEAATRDLQSGKNVVIHCRQGIGRSGLVAACLLLRKGMSPGAAVDRVSAARGIRVPETEEQRDWIDHFASAFAK